MGLLDLAKGALTGFTQLVSTDWWLEITTAKPRCTYYFGPFNKAVEAETARFGYIEDLEQEGAQDITATIKRCKPTVMTICEEIED
ncbi:MAG: DUF1816 domain-containing protein [Leptolyngbyaceae cyanobacterium RU_5_1]|nr:DUF1816 domain-containing protein [Leptolyngbyaceae cyanobacterium RU_5_1]